MVPRQPSVRRDPRGAHRPAVRGWARHLHHHRSGSAGRGRGCGRAGLAPNRRRRIVQPRRCCGRHGRHSGRRRPHPCHGRRPRLLRRRRRRQVQPCFGIGPTGWLVDEADRSGRRSPTRHPDHPLLRRHFPDRNHQPAGVRPHLESPRRRRRRPHPGRCDQVVAEHDLRPTDGRHRPGPLRSDGRGPRYR